MKKNGPKTKPLWQDSPLVEEHEIFATLAERKGSSLFLGRYSLNEVQSVMGKRGLFKEAARKGLWPLAFDLDSREYPFQRLQIFLRDKNPDNLIVDLKIREAEYPLKIRIDGLPAVISPKSLIFEWLTLQNPQLTFSEKLVPLPGQQRPGLSLSKKIMDIFVYLARLTRKDCLLAFPAYFHNALLFSRYFQFINPEKEGEVRAIRKAFSHMPFKHLAWIVHWNCLKRGDGSVYEWKAEEQVYPLNKTLKDHLGSRDYRDRMKAAQRSLEFSVDRECFRAKAGEVPALYGAGENLL
ncbi:MAG: hypothetical protein ACYDH0_11730 [Candidatus Aminicenantales bacterium]